MNSSSPANSPADALARTSGPSRAGGAGFTLMEMVVGLTIFMMVSIGLSALVLQSRKLSELAVLRNTASTVAQGYLEQLESINAADINSASDPLAPNRPPLPTMSLSYLTGNNIETSDPLYVSPIVGTMSVANVTARTDVPGDVWNVKNIMVDLSGNTTPIMMTMWIDVHVWRDWSTLLGNATLSSVPAPCILISMTYNYQFPGYNSLGNETGQMCIARTDLIGN